MPSGREREALVSKGHPGVSNSNQQRANSWPRGGHEAHLFELVFMHKSLPGSHFAVSTKAWRGVGKVCVLSTWLANGSYCLAISSQVNSATRQDPNGRKAEE